MPGPTVLRDVYQTGKGSPSCGSLALLNQRSGVLVRHHGCVPAECSETVMLEAGKGRWFLQWCEDSAEGRLTLRSASGRGPVLVWALQKQTQRAVVSAPQCVGSGFGGPSRHTHSPLHSGCPLEGANMPHKHPHLCTLTSVRTPHLLTICIVLFDQQRGHSSPPRALCTC